MVEVTFKKTQECVYIRLLIFIMPFKTFGGDQFASLDCQQSEQLTSLWTRFSTHNTLLRDELQHERTFCRRFHVRNVVD